jgi:threonylcarbamoyladenosine tRNA methylthiotransferase MtaB
MSSVFIHNFGCRVNQAEAFDWADRLAEAGLRLAGDWRKAEIVVVNSCALTARAEADVRQFLRRIQRESPGARIIITGCLTEKATDWLGNNIKPWRIIPNSLKDDLALELISLPGDRKDTSERKPFRSRALVKVQDGCDARCTFCIIPSLRGPSRSLPLKQVLERACRAVEQGYNELVLAGIHLSAYGQDLSPRKSLLDLLQTLVSVEGLKLIRLSSLDPRLMPEELLGFLVSERKLCPHYHLSLQHASEAVLRKMGRKSTPEEYLQILTYLRTKRPEVSLGADIIVGFPGEEEADFDFLRNFLRSCPLNYFHVFSFSPRPGTPAARWPQVPDNLRKKRSEQLRQLSREKNLSFQKAFSGKIVPSVVVRIKESRAEVLTHNYIKVQIEKSSELRQRQFLRVRISEVSPAGARGEVV